MGRRTLLLITSVLIAAVGTALVAIYVRGADQRAVQGAKVVRVLVAQKPVAAGTTVAIAERNASFGLGEVLQRQVQRGDIVVGLDQLDGMDQWVTRGPILEGQAIQKGMFQQPGEATVTGLDKSKMGVSVQMADPNRVAAYLRQNSRVAVFLIMGAQGGGQGGEQSVRLLLPAVRVLAVGSQAVAAPARQSGDRSGGAQENVPTTVVTLDVNQAEAEKVMLGRKVGELYFTLLGEDAKGTASQGTTTKNLFNP